MPMILYPDDAGVIQSVWLDDLEGAHEMSATPTDHAIEDGSTVTDHVKVELDAWSGRCLVTNSLIDPEETQMNGAVSATQSVDTPAGSVSVVGLSEAVDRIQLVFDVLREIRASRRVCTIVTKYRRYESMILTRFSFPEANRDGVEITIEARQLRIVSTRTVASPRPRQVRGRARAQAGTVTTQAVPTSGPQPPPAPPERSTAAQLLDSLFG